MRCPIISILQLRTLRLRELKYFPESHMTSDWKWWDWEGGQLTSARKSWHSLGLRCDIEIYTECCSQALPPPPPCPGNSDTLILWDALLESTPYKEFPANCCWKFTNLDQRCFYFINLCFIQTDDAKWPVAFACCFEQKFIFKWCLYLLFLSSSSLSVASTVPERELRVNYLVAMEHMFSYFLQWGGWILT